MYNENLFYIAIGCALSVGLLLGYIWAQETRAAKEKRFRERIKAIGENIVDYYYEQMIENTEKSHFISPAETIDWPVIKREKPDMESALAAQGEKLRGLGMDGKPNGCLDEILSPYDTAKIMAYLNKRRAAEKKIKQSGLDQPQM